MTDEQRTILEGAATLSGRLDTSGYRHYIIIDDASITYALSRWWIVWPRGHADRKRFECADLAAVRVKLDELMLEEHDGL
ncbi:MAG: hypothetical protein V3S94_05655 [Gammaproteobacteria bacterium]